MDIFTIYIAAFFIVFLIMPIVYYIARFIIWLILKHCACAGGNVAFSRNNSSENRQRNRHRTRSNFGLIYDRQGNVFTIADDTSGNAAPHRYADFFYLEPSTEDAARIRSQLEKDDKELPSYDDVMNMSSIPTSPTTTAPPTVVTFRAAVPAADTLPPPSVPPYSEIDPNAITVAMVAARAVGDTGQYAAAAAGVPSTSRAAANATTTPADATVITLPIANSASNTSV